MTKYYLTIAFLILISSVSTQAQTSTFTYQGRLTNNATPASGIYDMQFRLYDTPGSGTGILLAGPITDPSVQVTNGVFTTTLDFGASVFNGSVPYLEVAVRPAGSTGGYTLLAPRQQVTSTPYAIQSLKAATADSATNATNATTATSFSGNLTGDVSGPQSGTVVNSVGGQTAADVAGGAQLANAATSANTPGAIVRRDAFAGGFSAGVATINQFRLLVSAAPTTLDVLRVDAPASSVFTLEGPILRLRSDAFGGGPMANRFLVDRAGSLVASSEIGNGIIPATGDGDRLMWYGYKAAFRAGGVGDATGVHPWDDANIGFYSWAGGFDTIAKGIYSFAMGRLTSATGQSSAAIGERVSAIGNYTVALGRHARTGCQTGDANCATPFARNGSFVFGDGSSTADFDSVANNEFAVRASGGYRFFSDSALTTGLFILPNANVGIGITAPSYKLHVMDPTNKGLRVQTDATGGTVASFGGNGAFQIDSFGIPGGRLNVAETGQISFGTLGTAGSIQLCRNAANQIASCSSSLRYKEKIVRFAPGLNFIDQLKPIGFRWKAGGMADVGFGAEDVAKIDPLFVNYNAKGEIEGVKYDRFSVVFVNAFKEQQQQIESQKKEIEALKTKVAEIESQQKQIEELKSKATQIDKLKRLVCAQNEGAALCKEDK